MDFQFSEEQTMLRTLAREILEAEVSVERVKEVEKTTEWFDRKLWEKLAQANLLGVPVPEAQGGMGYGLTEVCVLLEEIGRVLAPVPAIATLVQGALSIARFGSPALQKQYLEGVAAGSVVLTAALEDAGSRDPLHPATKAVKSGAGGVNWKLDGVKCNVTAAHLVARILVPAQTDAGIGIFLVDPKASGVSLVASKTSTGESLFRVDLSGVVVDASDVLSVGAAGAAALRWIFDASVIAYCALQIGISDKALEITSGYLRERVQFGVPIGSFQAVQHRAANGFIDLQAMRWCTWRAAERLAQDLSSEREVCVAKYWSSVGGSRIADTCMHLHAGVGVDVDYPIHRYFLWSKASELALGNAAIQLNRLGADMAANPPQEVCA